MSRMSSGSPQLIPYDAQVLGVFERTYRAEIWAVAHRITRDEWDAEEVVQDVLWTVYRKADSFRGDTDVWHWVRRITQNAARMLLRKRRRRPLPIEDAEIEAQLHSRAVLLDRMEAAVGAKRAALSLERALGAQDATNKELFLLVDVGGMENADVAKHLGLTVSAVKARLHRIRHTLHEAASEGLDGLQAAA